MADATLDHVIRTARLTRAATARAADLRDARDAAILAALGAGHGVREVARAAQVGPTQVQRVRDVVR